MEEPQGPQQLIVAGHYRKISSLKDEKPEIVRVLGPHPTRKHAWSTMDGKTISESELMDAWEPLDMTHDPEVKARKANLLAGLEPFDQAMARAEAQNPVPEPQPEPYHTEERQLFGAPPDPAAEMALFNKRMGVQTAPASEPAPQPIVKPFVAQLFERLTASGDPGEIDIAIRLPLGFSVEKLKESISLLDLDAAEITAHIVGAALSSNRLKNAVSEAVLRELNAPEKPKAAGRLKMAAEARKGAETPTPEDDAFPAHATLAPAFERGPEPTNPPPLPEGATEPSSPGQLAMDDAVNGLPTIENVPEQPLEEPLLEERISEIETRAKGLLEKYLG